ncbi:MAG: PD40 domain-containing protein [Phycisphaeraceae bacterium]|nr:PD40 domain-containing protein [Phycisphaeraceae bacterium]
MICSARKFSLALFTALAGLATNSPAQALFAASTSAVGLLQTDLAANTVALPQHPAMSPDGRHIAFASQGDLWLVSSSGGVAARLTNHPATERRCEFSPDGRLLAFESDRDGGRNLYVLPLLSGPGGELLAGETRRVHVMDRSQSLSSFTPCGNYLLLNSNHEPAIYRGQRMYRVPVTGGPLERLTDAHGNMPRLSPEGDTLVFAYRRYDYNRPRYRGSGTSDLWSMNVPTGEFTQLTTHAADDADGFPLADGSIIFVSSRDGQNNLWRLPKGAPDDQARQLTRFQPTDEISIGHGVRDLNVSADGRSAVFVVWDTLYTLDLSNPTAQPRALRVVTSSGANETDWNRTNIGREVSEAALSPDGKTIAVVARGEIFIRSTQENRPTRRLTSTSGRERDLAWSADNSTLYFVSDEGGLPRLYAATVAFSRDDLQPAKPAVQAEEPAPPGEEPAGSPDADTPERAEGSTEPEPADKPQATDDPPPKSDTQKSAKDEPDLGKRWAESIRYTIHPVMTGLESDEPCFRNGIFGIEISSPMPSADGEKLLFIRGRGDLVLHDLKTGANRVLFESWNRPEVQWAGDSRHIVYAVNDHDFQSDIYILDTGNPEAAPVNVTRHPDIDDSPRLTHDGKVLYFRSERAGNNFDYDVWYVFLDRSLEAMTPYELDEYFKNAADEAKKLKPIKPTPTKPADEPAEKKGEENAQAENGEKPAPARKKAAPKKAEPLKFDTDDAYLRVRRLTSIPGGLSGLFITPAGDRVMFNSSESDRAFVSVSRKNDDRKVIQAGGASPMGVSISGDKVTYVARGQAYTANPVTGKSDLLATDGPVVIDVGAEQRQKFNEAARTIGNVFYHPTLKGLDWRAISRRYETLAQRTRTPEELTRVVQMLFGELDGSHTGMSAAGGFSAPSLGTGYLGIETRPAPNGLEVSRVLAESPASLPIGGVKFSLDVGDVIVSVDDRAVRGEQGLHDLATMLMGKSGQETLLEIERVDAEKPRFLLIVPISGAAEGRLRYQAEVLRRAKVVDELSGGKLGYLHIQGMSMPSVRDFERDLYAAAAGKDGLIIDVRDNGGGSTADILLSSLTAPPHAFTIPRGADPSDIPTDAYPRDRRLIYGYSRPITVLINENSFSNAEIFAHAIKNIGRGVLVGTATYGGVISTGAASLIDGSTIRTPFRGWYLPDGTDYENNGAQPDINVPMTPTAEAAGADPQLDAAVNELLQRAAQARRQRESVKAQPVPLPR